MKKVKIVFFILLITLFSCKNFNPMRQGMGGYSKSLKESKERDAFVADYKYIVYPDSLKSSLNFEVEELFVEKLWNYGLYLDWTEFKYKNKNEYRIIFKFKDESEMNKFYKYNYFIGQKVEYFRNENSLYFNDYVVETVKYGLTDTFKYEIAEIDTTWKFYPPKKTIHLGYLYLIKK